MVIFAILILLLITGILSSIVYYLVQIVDSLTLLLGQFLEIKNLIKRFDPKILVTNHNYPIPRTETLEHQKLALHEVVNPK